MFYDVDHECARCHRRVNEDGEDSDGRFTCETTGSYHFDHIPTLIKE